MKLVKASGGGLVANPGAVCEPVIARDDDERRRTVPVLELLRPLAD